jgi:hypothetical protein
LSGVSASHLGQNGLDNKVAPRHDNDLTLHPFSGGNQMVNFLALDRVWTPNAVIVPPAFEV